MATPEVTQSYEDSVYRSAVDFKVPTTHEIPVDDWPQEVTDILSPDLINGETYLSARQLGHEDGAVGMITPSTMVALSTPVVAPPSTISSTDLPATTEETLNNARDDSLPSAAENPDLIIGESDSSARQVDHENGTVGTISSSIPLVTPSTKASTDIPATMEATPNNAPDDSLSSTTEDSLLLTPKDSLLLTPEISPPSTLDMGFPETKVALSSNNDSTLREKPAEKLALRILDIIQRYGHSSGSGTGVDWAGKSKFLPLVEQSVEKNEAVKMVLPAFPCVSVFDCFSFRPFF